MEPHPLGAELLKQWREARGVFQTSIADALNIRQNTVSEWEKGSRRPDLPNALRLAHHTGGAVAATAWGYSPEDVARFVADMAQVVGGRDAVENITPSPAVGDAA